VIAGFGLRIANYGLRIGEREFIILAEKMHGPATKYLNPLNSRIGLT
jgi:hypothetical protein